MNFCSHCGAPVSLRIPPGDDRPRFVCTVCDAVHYRNPLVVVGCIPLWERRILLCRRAIEPRAGKWTIPAGYLENGETVAAGAVREVREEARAHVREPMPFGLYNICHVNQIYLIFHAQMADAAFGAGSESQAARLFEIAQLPWDQLAFPVIERTLKNFAAACQSNDFRFHIEDITDRLGLENRQR